MTTPKKSHEAFFLADLACNTLEKIAKKSDNNPFHLRVDFWGPHEPYFAPQEYIDLYSNGYINRIGKEKEIDKFIRFINKLLSIRQIRLYKGKNYLIKVSKIMPNFIDLFGNEINNKKEKFVQYLTEGLKLRNLKSDYKKQFEKYFLPLQKYIEADNQNFKAIAIDASGKKREFSNGTYFYLTRASGIINSGEILRNLEAEVFTLEGSGFEVNTYFGRKSENLEFQILEKYLKSQKKEEKTNICFIDGSLYSRIMSHIVESPVLEDEAFIIDHINRVFQVLKEAKRKNVLIVGLSKDSRDNFFRNALLDEVYYENREKIKNSLTLREYNLIKEVIKGIDNSNNSKIKQFKELITKKPKLLKKIKSIYEEYLVSRTDWEIIYRFSKYPGFSFPIEKGLGRIEQQRIFKNMIKNSQNYLINHFRKYISKLNTQEKSKFLKRSEKIIKQFSNIPTFLSFHIFLDLRDNPIKIDIPSWYFSDWNYLTKFPYVKFREIIETLLVKIISIIKELYGGIDNYNILLSAAHDDAVLGNRVYNEVYETFLQDKLDLNLLYYQKRRIKRMKR
ncbi:MAG: hypothetical protein GF311_12780 [Candidatus Lokiarchaeota archaeon]|nr:hypothetical protein [Candidatus Lokiarchaeota archaeon]